MERNRKLHWYKFVVKRYLRDLKASIDESKNDMERSYYISMYKGYLRDFAKAMGVAPKCLEKYI